MNYFAVSANDFVPITRYYPEHYMLSQLYTSLIYEQIFSHANRENYFNNNANSKNESTNKRDIPLPFYDTIYASFNHRKLL